MLPVFPKARKAMADVFNHYLFEALWTASPVLREIPVSNQLEGQSSSYERVGGKVVDVEYKAASVERRFKFEYAKGLDPEEFLDGASSIGEEISHKMTSGILSSVNQAVEEVGNVTVSASGQITFEDFIKMNTKMQLEFKDDGTPVDRVMLLSPEMSVHFGSKLRGWQDDPEKRMLMDALIKKKKEEFNEREARRRMVD